VNCVKCFWSNVYKVALLLMVMAAIMASVLRLGVPFLSASSSSLLDRIASFFVKASTGRSSTSSVGFAYLFSP